MANFEVFFHMMTAENGFNHQSFSASIDNYTSLDDLYKIIIPSFCNLDDTKDENITSTSVCHLLVAETTDAYLNLANNNNNYSDDGQPLFLTICVTAIDKLRRSVGVKTNLLKSFESHLKAIISAGTYEICNPLQMTNIIQPEDQGIMSLNATANVFKIFQGVLRYHKTVINIFNDKEISY